MIYSRENVDAHCLVFCADSSKELRLVVEVDTGTNTVKQHDLTYWTDWDNSQEKIPVLYTKYKSIDVELNSNGLPIKFTLVGKIK